MEMIVGLKREKLVKVRNTSVLRAFVKLVELKTYQERHSVGNILICDVFIV